MKTDRAIFDFIWVNLTRRHTLTVKRTGPWFLTFETEEAMLTIEPIRIPDDSNFVVHNPEMANDPKKAQVINITCPAGLVKSSIAVEFDRVYPGWRTLEVFEVEKLPTEGEIPRNYLKRFMLERQS